MRYPFIIAHTEDMCEHMIAALMLVRKLHAFMEAFSGECPEMICFSFIDAYLNVLYCVCRCAIRDITAVLLRL